MSGTYGSLAEMTISVVYGGNVVLEMEAKSALIFLFPRSYDQQLVLHLPSLEASFVYLMSSPEEVHYGTFNLREIFITMDLAPATLRKVFF